MLSKQMKWTGPMTIGAMLLVACAPELESTDDDISEQASPLEINNGIGLNGISVNGISINGISINGISINGISINGISINGTQLTNGSISGTGFVGANANATLSTGAATTLHIDDIVQSPTDSEMWLYYISYNTGSTMESVCGYDSYGEVRPAIALGGRWDYTAGTSTGGDWINDATQFTFSCVNAALAKCVTLGYKPWKTSQECNGGTCQTLSLRSHHQACTRMIRADYCGDGQAHTVDGVSINVWDNQNIQTKASVPATWLNNAEWTPDGAACISNYRYNPGNAASSYVASNCSSRTNAGFTCFSSGSTFFTANGYSTPLIQRSLIRNQFDPASVP